MLNLNKRSVIVDIDGTVSSSSGRGWYDYSKAADDYPIGNIIRLVQLLHSCGIRIVFCTGRNEESRSITESWLRKHVFLDSRAPVEVYMRPRGDNRSDFIVKEELYRNFIEPIHDVWLVIDDRDEVVKMWRKIGLTCMQVSDSFLSKGDNNDIQWK